MISKSDYMAFLKHPAWLWVKKHTPDKIPPVDPATQAMFDAGHAFESYVEVLFPGGIKIDFADYFSMPERTQQAIDSGAKTLFQPRFDWGEFTCICDILEIVGEKLVDLYEIKSSTSVKPEHLYDLAFQKAVLEGNGWSVRNVSVIHANNQYVRRGEIDPKKLTTFVDVTEEVAKLADFTAENMPKTLEIVNQTEMPNPDPELTKFGYKADWLAIYENIFPPEPAVWPENTQPTVDQKQINDFLNRLKYPLYFLDYETMMSLIPYFDGHRPYQQVPMQYSLHIVREPGGEVEHKEYLHRENSDPAEPLAKQLIADIGDTGSVIVWYQGFEKARNSELGEILPQYQAAMTAINDRVVDLMIPFKAKWYDDPRFEGSASIKKVLPVVCPELGYDELGIQEGASAQRLWMEAVLDGQRADEKDQILADLVEYCKMDTWAMVRIWQELLKI